MTIQDLINRLSEFQLGLLIVFCAIPFVAFLGGLIQGNKKCKESKTRYLYSVLIYLSCIPGMFSVVLTAYSLFFLKANLLKVNLLIYILPIISMVATLAIIKRKNSFDDIPGFERILGLMLMIGISFAVAFVIHRTFVFIGFIGRLTGLLVVALVVFILLKIAADKITKR
ncbi:MAG: hypothetical protein JSV88_10130 [Candidatus Aminicenantes bacterium]|nr:MAG: hypothetical protein JSV88_10130 [Candidatus Aminicenantes bacterium]